MKRKKKGTQILLYIRDWLHFMFWLDLQFHQKKILQNSWDRWLDLKSQNLGSHKHVTLCIEQDQNLFMLFLNDRKKLQRHIENLTLNTVRITVNSALVIGTESRSFVFLMLFTTAVHSISYDVSLQNCRKEYSSLTGINRSRWSQILIINK